MTSRELLAEMMGIAILIRTTLTNKSKRNKWQIIMISLIGTQKKANQKKKSLKE